MHAGLFCCFHSPPNSDMDYRIFNMHMWSFCMHIHTGDLSLYSHPKDFCRVCTELKISGQAQSLAHKGHPSIWWPCSIVLNSGFQERILLLCATDSPDLPYIYKKLKLTKNKTSWLKIIINKWICNTQIPFDWIDRHWSRTITAPACSLYRQVN